MSFAKIFTTIFFISGFLFNQPLNAKGYDQKHEEIYPTVILGGGVGALTSALYLARAGYPPVIIEGSLPGGLITQSHMVENWPGEMQITGSDLADKIRKQAESKGCRFLAAEVIDIDFSQRPFEITIIDLFDKEKRRVIKGDTCIIAMGTSSNYLNVPGERQYWGKGISNCAICDGSFYKDKTVAVIGGRDSAILEAHYLSNIAKQVYVLVRQNALKTTEKERLKELFKKGNVTILYNTVINAIEGDKESVKNLKVENSENKDRYNLDVDGIFLAIGSKPNSQMFSNKIKLDNQGYISVKEGQETSVKGVYAVGDIVDPIYKQAITAAGDGAKAAISAQKFLEKNRNVAYTKVSYENEKSVNKNAVIEIASQEHFEEEIKSSDLPILIDFYATWCRPCTRIAPVISAKAKILQDKVKILKVDVSKFPDISRKYKVYAMPTVVALDNEGAILFKKIGPQEIADLLNSLEKIKESSVADIREYLMKE